MSVCVSSQLLAKSSFRSMLCAGIALLGLLSGCEKKVEGSLPPQKVGVVTVHTQNVTLETSLPGRVEAYEQAQIRPQVSGVIVSRNFEQGVDVQAGQQLYQIYIAPFQAAYDQAKGHVLEADAAAQRAKEQLRRYKSLVGPHAVSQQDYDNTLAASKQADAQLLEAKAALETASVNLNYTHVRAPISGRIGRTLYTEGTLVTAGQTQPIAVVTRLDPIYVDVNLAAEDMLRLRRELANGQLERKGDDAAVSLELPDGSLYEKIGKLELSEVTVDPSTGTLVMRAVMPNADRLLLPGMFVHAHIREGSNPTALMVPQLAIQRTPKSDPYVMVVDNQSKVHMRLVTLGRTVGNEWLVTSGLKAGERVVVSGLQKITPEGVVSPYEASAVEQGAE